jgi:ribosomal protein S27AE
LQLGIAREKAFNPQNNEEVIAMPEQSCPECGASLFYDTSTKRYACKGCGLYVTKDELVNIRDKLHNNMDESRKKRAQQSEYLEWWLSSKK